MFSTASEDQLLQGLEHAVHKHLPGLPLTRIERAYRFAQQAHEGQFRMSGEPYICHPVETAKILAELKMDEETLIAALLHDVPEDTSFTLHDVEKQFGKNVMRLVSALTKLSKVHYRHSMGERKIESLRKMFLETASDVRVVIIKLADRLHNMRTIQYLRPDKQQRIAKETIEIYAPLANLYGIFQLRRQLEDLCFSVLQPEEYARIDAFVSEHEKKRHRFVLDTIAVLKKMLKKVNIRVDLDGRPKHYYSIYQKMIRRGKVLSDINDYFAIRIITERTEDCYRALAVVHECFRPKPGRFKDYIALPKPNGYQSLHTTVVGLQGKLTEVQIRTRTMHQEAEFGAAAHLLYKNWRGSFASEVIEQLKKYKHPENFIKNLQDDLLQHRIFVFTSKGDIVHLPSGSTCLDFIYAVGIPVDEHSLKPFVNGRAYSLFGELQSGDHVNIQFGPHLQSGPERGWLDHVKTTKAKEKIQDYFRRQSPKTKVGLGVQLLQRELDHENQGLIYNLDRDRIEHVLRHFRFQHFDELLEKIGDGTFGANQVYKVMFPEVPIGPFSQLRHLWFRLKNRFNSSPHSYKYRIRILVDAYDRVGLFKDLLKPFYDLKLSIVRIHGVGYDVRNEQVVESEYISRDTVDVLIEDHEQLIALFDRLEKIPGVIRVQRSFRRNQASFIILSILTGIYFLGHPFAIEFLLGTNWALKDFTLQALVYIGLFALFFLMMWLRSLGNKTFPHLEETKGFWPFSFGLSFLAIVTLLVDNAVYDLNLHWPLMLAFSIFIFSFLTFSYHAHVKQRQVHLDRLKERSAQVLNAAPQKRSHSH